MEQANRSHEFFLRILTAEKSFHKGPTVEDSRNDQEGLVFQV